MKLVTPHLFSTEYLCLATLLVTSRESQSTCQVWLALGKILLSSQINTKFHYLLHILQFFIVTCTQTANLTSYVSYILQCLFISIKILCRFVKTFNMPASIQVFYLQRLPTPPLRTDKANRAGCWDSACPDM